MSNNPCDNNDPLGRSLTLGNPGDTPDPRMIYNGRRVVVEAYIENLKNKIPEIKSTLTELNDTISQMASDPTIPPVVVARLRTEVSRLLKRTVTQQDMLENLEEQYKELVNEENERKCQCLIAEVLEVANLSAVRLDSVLSTRIALVCDIPMRIAT